MNETYHIIVLCNHCTSCLLRSCDLNPRATCGYVRMSRLQLDMVLIITNSICIKIPHNATTSFARTVDGCNPAPSQT